MSWITITLHLTTTHILTLLLCLIQGQGTNATERPIIGVFTRLNRTTGEHYIAASYVKWLESAGARAVPIHADMTSEEDLRVVFEQINGLLLPGGGDGTSMEAAKLLWEMANTANESGDHFPIWGTCLGFEWMLELASSNNNNDDDAGDKEDIVQSGFVADDVSLVLEFTKYGIRDSNMFADEDVQEICASDAVAYNHHQRGIEPDALLANEGLNDMFEITSISYDTNGRAFVSSMEAKDVERYPYYAVQWHPEKNNFEYGTIEGTEIPYAKGIRHTTDSIHVSQYLANVLVTESRRSQHEYYEMKRFPLIWTYQIKQGIEFEQYFVISDQQYQSNLRGSDNFKAFK